MFFAGDGSNYAEGLDEQLTTRQPWCTCKNPYYCKGDEMPNYGEKEHQYTPHNETQPIVDYMERDREEDTYPYEDEYVYDPDDYPSVDGEE